MTKKKLTHKKEDNSLKKNVVFCSECGEELEFFGIDSNIDLEKVKARHKKCREIGKFKGDKCAMLFIAESEDTDLFNDEED